MKAYSSLIIFVINPILGKVKTCVQASLGSEAGLRVYKKLLHHTYDAVVNILAEVEATVTNVHLIFYVLYLRYWIKHQWIMGRQKNGGYYFLGMNNFIPQLFEHKNFSSSTVLKETTGQFKSFKISYQTLPNLRIRTRDTYTKFS